MSLSPAVFHVMLSVADGPRHGYAIMRDVEERTEGRVQLGPGTLYGAIRRLREQDLIEEVEGVPVDEGHDERRRYYQLTREGRAAAAAEARRLQRLVRTARGKQLLPAEDRA